MDDYIIRMRRQLHEIPETRWDLPETSAFIEKELENMGLEYRKIKDTGFIVTLKSENKNARTIAFRCDMDALDVTETFQCSYKSKHNGKMHACGHDGHMAIMLDFLNSIRNKKIPCNVVAVFQPSEENMSGAREFINEPEIKSADGIFAIHLWTPINSGKICVAEGPRMASADNFEIRIKGESCHGGEPHRGIDPVPAACACVQAIQTYVSRRLNPNETAVITVGQIQGGTAHNIIAPYVDLKGTARAFNPEVRKDIRSWVSETADNIAKAYSCSSETQWFLGTPAVINNAEMSEIAEKAAEKVMGKDAVIDFPKVSAGEDFALFQEVIPGCMMLLGAMTEEYYPHHHSSFNIDESVLKKGSEIFQEIVFMMK